MAIIYTYPQINSSSDLAASDLMIISDMSANGRPTKALKLSDLATFITNTGTGSGTTNKITKWTDGASGVLGDSSITDIGNQVSMSTDFIINSNGGNNAKFITDWGDHRVSILDALGAYTFTAADLDGGGKIGVNKQFPSTTLHVGGTGTFDSSLSIPLIPTANAHATSKQYVDQQIASIPAGLVFQGNWNASTNTPALASGTGTVGNYYVVSVAGNTNLDGITDWEVGDWAVFVEVGGVDKWDKIDQTFVQGAGATGQVSFWNGVNSVTGDNDLYWDNSNKRLGIGTTSPDSLLEISSGTTTDFLKLTSTGSNASPAKIIFEKSATEQGIVEYVRNGDLRIYNTDADGGVLIDGSSASGNDLYVKNDGKVGIGTTSPSSKLTVLGSTKLEGTGNKIFFGGNNTFIGENSNSNELILRGGGSTTTESVYIDTNGRIGIGTSNPSYKLEVNAGTDNQSALFESTDVTNTIGIKDSATTLSTSTGIGVVGDDLYLYAGGTAYNQRLRVQGSTGNVGIGTTNPGEKLHVVDGSDSFKFSADIGSGFDGIKLEGGAPGINFTGPGDDFVVAKITAGLSFFNNTVQSYKMVLTDAGNLGVGHSFLNPTVKLQVKSGNENLVAQFESDDSIAEIRIKDSTAYSRLLNVGTQLKLMPNDGVEMLVIDGNTNTVNVPDDKSLTFGANNDLVIQHNSGASLNQIDNINGDLYIQQNASDKDIIFRNDDGSGGITEYFRVDGGTEDIRFSKKTRHFDNVRAEFGDGGEFDIYYNGSNAFLVNGGSAAGDIQIINNTDDGDIKFFCDDGTGSTTEYFRLDGGNSKTTFSKNYQALDNVKAQFGDSNDLQIYHDGSNSYIDETGTGDLIVKAVDDVYIRGNTHDMGRFNEQGVKFYYLGNVKLETNNTGVKIPTAGDGLQLVSPNGTVYTVTVDNSGNLTVT